MASGYPRRSPSPSTTIRASSPGTTIRAPSPSTKRTPSPSTSRRSASPLARLMAGTRLKRSVKQPVSYAEPPLNSKLRKGHVYFPRSAAETKRSDEGRELTRTRQGTEEILKDLSNPVRS
eukprot:CAMPEP_0116824362 /NCGR_PEP_ID=MMETSP0418-20121206/1353_1 /TAXON_ID=1158023 /ORGANISM="Astrosyne radiata, Strain 13vi08-1A" /LENGTH=119 /DNA_ID=CAMNT_0004452721 /DNA_START=105 /DNA_END=464 /DNA_ORIENTATION=-